MDTNFGRQHILSLPNNICCIYKITSPSGKVYIGQTTNLKRRLNAYRNQLCKGQRHLYHSLMKYGAEKHSYQIVHELPNDVTSDILNDLEILYISLYSNCGIALLNGSEGGGGLRRKMTEEHIKKAQQNKGKIKHSEESKRKISQSLLKHYRPIL